MEVKKSREYLFVLLWHLLKRNLSSSFGRTSDDRDIEAKKYTGMSSKSAMAWVDIGKYKYILYINGFAHCFLAGTYYI